MNGDPGLFWFGFFMGGMGLAALLLIVRSVALWLFMRGGEDDDDGVPPVIRPRPLRLVKGGKR